jgi:hypothetical protein
MELQNYSRNRKSRRIQQPELDSKTCSTFPVMAGSSFVCMSDEQVLPLQYFDIFCVSKVLIEKPAHTDPSLACSEKKSHIVTAVSGPWAEALEQVALLSNGTLHKPKPVALQGWAIVRCQSKSGLWPSCRRRGASGTVTVDPSSRARYTGSNMNNWNMYTNVSLVTYPVFGVCTLAVQWEHMRNLCRRSRVRTCFAPFFNPRSA